MEFKGVYVSVSFTTRFSGGPVSSAPTVGGGGLAKRGPQHSRGFQHQSGNPGRGADPGVFVWWNNRSGAVQLLVTSGVANSPGAGGRRPQWKPVPQGLFILWASMTETLNMS